MFVFVLFYKPRYAHFFWLFINYNSSCGENVFHSSTSNPEETQSQHRSDLIPKLRNTRYHPLKPSVLDYESVCRDKDRYTVHYPVGFA